MGPLHSTQRNRSATRPAAFPELRGFPPREKSGRHSGFTLIELLAVVAILSILAGISSLGIQSYRERALIARAHSDLDTIAKAIFLFEMDTQLWPPNQPPRAGQGGGNEVYDLAPHLVPKYMAAVPKDPWGRNYYLDTDYHIGGKICAALASAGPNGTGWGGTTGDYDSDNVVRILACP